MTRWTSGEEGAQGAAQATLPREVRSGAGAGSEVGARLVDLTVKCLCNRQVCVRQNPLQGVTFRTDAEHQGLQSAGELPLGEQLPPPVEVPLALKFSTAPDPKAGEESFFQELLRVQGAIEQHEQDEKHPAWTDAAPQQGTAESLRL